jgi:hypothetical protein
MNGAVEPFPLSEVEPDHDAFDRELQCLQTIDQAPRRR